MLSSDPIETMLDLSVTSEPVTAPVARPDVQSRSRFALPVAFLAFATWTADVAAIVLAALLCDAWDLPLRRVVPIALVCYSCMAQVAGAYDGDALLLVQRAWPRVLNAWTAAVLALAMLSYSLGTLAELPMRGLLLWFVTAAILIAGARTGLVIAGCRLKKAGAFGGRTAVVGAGHQGVSFVEHVYGSPDLAMALVGFFDDRPVASGTAATLPLPYLGGIDDLVRAIRSGTIDRVFLTLPWADEERVHAIIAALSATPVEIRLSPDRAGFALARAPVASIGGIPLITVLERPLSRGQHLQKAVEDKVLGLILLLLFLPVMLAVALLILLDSGGPVFFRQSREGFNCHTFEIFKFRTMHVNACAAEVVQAHRRDPRITRIGAILRRTSFDELPQLLNVLLGDMSLVGPRPHAPATRAGGVLFGEVISTYAARHKVKPGLTGWAQVSGWRGETTTTDQLVRRIEHDMYYVQNWSIWFDFYILGRTALTILVQRSAY